MARKGKGGGNVKESQTFLACLRKFLTPEVFKQAHQAHRRGSRRCRWGLQPLLLVLLTMTWCTGDSQPERFETARAFCVVLLPKRRRPGKTTPGFQKALARLPMSVLHAFAAAVRRRLWLLFDKDLLLDGWRPFGCDGSRLECPRTEELEQRLGEAGKPDSAPTIWVTALVHLRTGLLWSWWLGKGTASERGHLLKLLSTLPVLALVVADAGYTGFPLASALVDAQVAFLIRVSSKVELYTTEDAKPVSEWREGEVYYWPKCHQEAGEAPLHLRLIRIHSSKRKVDVWLLTNVMDAERLSVETAGKFYKMRWENEGLFRTYKRTLAKVKLVSRTVALVHREAHGSLLALQLLLAQGTWALLVCARSRSAMSSPRQVLREIRREIQDALPPQRRASYLKRLAHAARERRERSSAKEKRVWPRRKPHKQPGSPKILTLTPEQKSLLDQALAAA